MSIEKLYSLNQKGILLPSKELFESIIPSENLLNVIDSLEVILNQPSEQLNNADSKEILIKFIDSATSIPNNYIGMYNNFAGINIFLIKHTTFNIEIKGEKYLVSTVVEKRFPIARFAITIYKDNNAIGFRDVEVRIDNTNSYGHRGPMFAILTKDIFGRPEGTELVKLVHFQFPGFDVNIREKKGDSFFVESEFRGKGIGKALFFLGLEMAKRLGADRHIITIDQSNRAGNNESFYSQFINKKYPDSFEWWFPLEDKDQFKGYFEIKES